MLWIFQIVRLRRMPWDQGGNLVPRRQRSRGRGRRSVSGSGRSTNTSRMDDGRHDAYRGSESDWSAHGGGGGGAAAAAAPARWDSDNRPSSDPWSGEEALRAAEDYGIMVGGADGGRAGPDPVVISGASAYGGGAQPAPQRRDPPGGGGGGGGGGGSGAGLQLTRMDSTFAAVHRRPGTGTLMGSTFSLPPSLSPPPAPSLSLFARRARAAYAAAAGAISASPWPGCD